MLKSFVSHFFVIGMIVQFLTGCSTLRTEFYRQETKYLYTTGTGYYKQGSYQKAKASFEAIIELDPGYGSAHAALGNLAMIRKEYDEAFEYYQQAIEHNPELAEELLSLQLTSIQHKVRQPLVEQGIDLSKIYKLLLADKFVEIEVMLQKDISLQLLASDTISLTPGRLGELRLKTETLAPTIGGSVRLRLFLGNILFSGQVNDSITIELLDRTVKEASGKEQQECYFLLGQLRERTKKKNEAVDDYLAAVKAGMPIIEVAPFLARIYKVDMATIMSLESKKTAILKVSEVIEVSFFKEYTTTSINIPAPRTNSDQKIFLSNTTSSEKQNHLLLKSK